MIRDVLVDFTGVAGVAGIGYGCWLIYQPAAPITVGTLMLVFAVIAGRKA